MENFTALVLVHSFLCFYCFIDVISAFLPFRNSSKFLVIQQHSVMFGLYPAIPIRFPSLDLSATLPPLLWTGSGEASTAHWCHRVCPGPHSQEMVPFCFPSLCSFSYITPLLKTRMAFFFIIMDIWDWTLGGFINKFGFEWKSVKENPRLKGGSKKVAENQKHRTGTWSSDKTHTFLATVPSELM